MKWFRLYSELLHDPKVQRLPPVLFKHWINLLCLANESTPRGMVPPVEDVAFALRISPAEARKALTALCAAGLLDCDTADHLTPHNWSERQRNSDDVAARVRRYRNGVHDEVEPEPKPEDMLPVTLHETLPVTGTQHDCNALEREEEREEDQKEIRSDQREGVLPPLAPAQPSPRKVTAQTVPKPRQTPMPDDWPLTDALLEWWDAQHAPAGIDPARETEKWQDYHRQKGTRVSDWAASWRNWMRKAIEYYPPPAAARNGSKTYATDQRHPDKLTGRLSGTADFLAGLDHGPAEGAGGHRDPNVVVLRARPAS